MTAKDRLETLVLRAVMSLPPRVQRRLAGKPVVLDGQTLSTETQLMLRLQQVAKQVGAETVPIPQGRLILDHQSAMTGGKLPVGSVRDLDVDGIPARLYTPTGAPDGTPLLVFLHGGGFIYGGLESHDAPCRHLAERARIRVLAVDYRLAPENPFPAAYDDALTAYRWAVKNAASLGADPAKLAVGGDSAGGNLAAGVALAAAREGLPLSLQVLVYPAVDNRRATRSLELFSTGFFLTADFMSLATASYTPEDPMLDDPRASPAYDDIPDGLAPVYICTAGFDPLRDEGEAYARKLADAGVEVELHRFPDQIHGFFNIVGVGRTARACVDEIADSVRTHLR